MRLTEMLRKRLEREQSPFQAQLLREDIDRLQRLEELGRTIADLDAFRHAGMRLNWTPGDARTHELREPLERLLEAIHARTEASPGSDQDAWRCTGCAWSAWSAACPRRCPSPAISGRPRPLAGRAAGESVGGHFRFVPGCHLGAGRERRLHRAPVFGLEGDSG